MKSIKIIISGRVQGVFFRRFVKTHADRLKLNGYAKNLVNGEVEVVVCGNETKVNELISYCRKGPDGANVLDFNIEEIEKRDFEGFRIIY